MKISSDIVRRLKERDEDAFHIVYDEYEKLIYYIAYSITKNRHDAEEIVQDTFLRMFNSINTYQENGKFKQWLMQIARNLSYNKVTRDKERDNVYDEEALRTAKASPSTAHLILTIQGILDEDSANIVILRVIYNFSFKEIAEETGFTIGKVQSMYYVSMKTLKKEFKYE